MTLLQWNCQGLRTKKDDLLDLIATYQPLVVALQETKLWDSATFSVPHYSFLHRSGHFNRTPHGGAALLVHESVPMQEISLTTGYQSTAVRVYIAQQEITVCSIYISPRHSLNFDSLASLLQQLPSPLLLLGDFNSHSVTWGCQRTDTRGRVVERVVESFSLNILNDFAATRIGHDSESAIDLSIASPILEPLLHWSVLSSTYDSDHCPISLDFYPTSIPSAPSTRFNYKRANWSLFSSHPLWDSLPSNFDTLSNRDLVPIFLSTLQRISEASVPQYVFSKYYPRPYWTAELSALRQTREHFYQRYRRVKSPGNRTLWHRARAEFRLKLRETKRLHWQKFSGTFTKQTPMSLIYENLRKLQGRRSRRVNILVDGAETFSTERDIANKLAATFQSTSSSDNYSPSFQRIREAAERRPLDFSSPNTEVYNRFFTLGDFDLALRSVKNTAAGPDGISYQVLKALPVPAKTWFLQMVNRFWRDGYFPWQWREAIILAFPKPGKDHSSATNYRPIALTSVLGKTVERMITTRLSDYLDMHSVLHRIQCGCRRNRSTTDHLVRLETAVRQTFAYGEHMVSIFFDLQKAYDTTWRYGIVRDLFTIGLRGRLPTYIANFLHDRHFRVRVGDTFSDWHVQEQGVPQGGVLSVTLFALRINGIASCVPANPRFLASLYVDDFQLSFRHADLSVISRNLQRVVDRVQQWTEENGFRFSESKTKAVHFTHLSGLSIPPLSAFMAPLFLTNLRLNSSV